METFTDDELFATIDHRGNVKVSLRKENKSVSTDNIEEVVDDDPFAGEQYIKIHTLRNLL